MKPSLFIGSSSESLGLARAVQAELSDVVDGTVWNQGIFELSRAGLDSLIKAAHEHDYAAFVLAPDDLRVMRESESRIARDNVVFELGMFFGSLGQSRCFFLMPTGVSDFRLPTDLAGITGATYDPNSHGGNVRASVSTACTSIRNAIEAHLGGRASLAGSWRQKWIVSVDGEIIENEGSAEVKHIDNLISATFSSLGQTYIFKGQIDRGNILTGIWRDSETGPTYFGSGQLVISPLKNEMDGQWLGWSRHGFVRSGEWIWKKVMAEGDVFYSPNS